MLISTGCQSLSARTEDAAIKIGIANADLYKARMPQDCHQVEPHAVLKVGMEVRSVLKLERKALDRANARVLRCAEFAEKYFVINPK